MASPSKQDGDRPASGESRRAGDENSDSREDPVEGSQPAHKTHVWQGRALVGGRGRGELYVSIRQIKP
jgi:hypothetical protein